MRRFVIKQHDTLPRLEAKLYDPDDWVVDPATGQGYFQPVSLANLDQLRFRLADTQTGRLKFNKPATIIAQTATETRVAYQWVTGDTDTPGHYQGEFEATFLDGSRRSYPTDENVEVIIVAEVGA